MDPSCSRRMLLLLLPSPCTNYCTRCTQFISTYYLDFLTRTSGLFPSTFIELPSSTKPKACQCWRTWPRAQDRHSFPATCPEYVYSSPICRQARGRAQKKLSSTAAFLSHSLSLHTHTHTCTESPTSLQWLPPKSRTGRTGTCL